MEQHYYIMISFVGEDAVAVREESVLKRTLDWFLEDMVFFNRDIYWTANFLIRKNIVVIGKKDDLQLAPSWCKTFETDESDLKQAITVFNESTDKREEVWNIFVLVRPSQLFRPFGLMQRLVDVFRHTKKPTVSASRVCDIGWRQLSLDGSWKATDDRSALFVDDRLMVFGGTQVDEAFDRTAEHSIVEVDCSDVLSPDDYTNFQVKHELECERERCIVIGSGLDLAGRKLGARIDSGSFGKVFRVNKLYGSLQDVGIRTDGFFSFGLEHFWDKRTLEWYDKVLPCGELSYTPTNSVNTPLCKEIMEKYPPFKMKPSTGFHAIYMLISRGYLPTVIGFGFKDGKRQQEKKFYCDGTYDYGEDGHDFEHENQLLQQFAEEGRVVLL